jgi:cation diffusion facilitator CzcD-associated flavoprotein CzcO
MPRSFDEIVRLSESMAESLESDDTDPDISLEEATVRAAALRRALAEAELGEAVAAARKAGLPWHRIGDAVGTSGEAARQKYRAVHERFVDKVKATGGWTVKTEGRRRAKISATHKDALEHGRKTIAHGRRSAPEKDASTPLRAKK